MIYTPDNNSAFFAEVEKGTRCEVNGDLFEYYLDILPPVFMGSMVTLVDGTRQYAMFGFCEGDMSANNKPIAFWKSDGRFFAQLANV